MEFTVKFTADNNNFVVHKQKARFGLAMLDRARVETDIPALETGRVVDGIADHFYLTCIEIVISEKIARKSKLFELDHRAVITTLYRLNGYVGVVPVIERNQETGEIIQVDWEYVVDTDAILEDWIAAGFPEKWYVTND